MFIRNLVDIFIGKMPRTTKTQFRSFVPVSGEIKILLVDDQKIVQQQLQQMLSMEDNLQIVGTAYDGKKAIALVESLRPDIILIDIEMPIMNGIEATSIIKRRFVDTKILVLSSQEDREYVQRIISTGADGYLLKSSSAEDLLTAIYSIYRGYSYFETRLLKKVQPADDLANSAQNVNKKQTATKNKYRSGTRLLVWSGLLASISVIGWFGYSYYLRQSAEPVIVNLLPVQKGTVEITVSESGKMELGGQQTLKSPGENATVEQVNVTEGEKVNAGNTLLVLRDRDAQEQEQEQRLENGKNALTQARNEEKVLEAQKKVKKKEARVREAEELFQEGYIPESELEEDREQLNTALTELNDARLELKLAKLDGKHGQAKLKNIQQKLRDRLVTSPMDGKVLSVRVKNGDGITTDTNLLSIGDPSQEVVKLQLTTLNAAKVELGQIARVSAIGPNAEIFTGKVIALSPQAVTESEDSSSNVSGNSAALSSDRAKVNAMVLLNKPSKTLIPGSQVNVEIILEQRQNVTTLPLETLQGNRREPFVWIEDERGRAKKQPITLGLEDFSSVEVTSGLKAGEQVVLPSPELTLTPGMPLQTNPEVLPPVKSK